MSRLEDLKAELEAIDHLNQFYWQTGDPDRYERLGYLVRQDRRRELVTEVLQLIQSEQWVSTQYPAIRAVSFVGKTPPHARYSTNVLLAGLHGVFLAEGASCQTKTAQEVCKARRSYSRSLGASRRAD